MTSLSPLLSKTKNKLTSLSLREQIMVAVGVAAIAYFTADQFYFTPQQIKAQTIQARLTQQQGTLGSLQNAIRAMESGTAVDPAAKQVLELEELKKQAAAIDLVLGNVQGTTPQIGTLIRSLIATQHQRIKLQSLKTIPGRSLVAASGAAPRAPGTAALPSKAQPQANGNATGAQPDVYRYGVQLEISGSYFDLLAYLKSLENNSRGLFWSDMKLTVSSYPEATLKVTIYILSSQLDPIIS
jgi:MSHA biogenesis protein MshJ